MILLYLLGLLFLEHCLAHPPSVHFSSNWDTASPLAPTVPHGYVSPRVPYQPSLVLPASRKATVYYLTTRTVSPTGATKPISSSILIAATYISRLNSVSDNIEDPGQEIVSKAIDGEGTPRPPSGENTASTNGPGKFKPLSIAQGIAYAKPILACLRATHLRSLSTSAKISFEAILKPAPTQHREVSPMLYYARGTPGINLNVSLPESKLPKIQDVSLGNIRDAVPRNTDLVVKYVPIPPQRMIQSTRPETLRMESTMLLFQISMSVLALIASYKLPFIYPVGRIAENFTRTACLFSAAFSILYGFRVVTATWNTLSDIKSMLTVLRSDGTYQHVWLPTREMVLDIFMAYNRQSVQLGAIYLSEATVMAVAAMILRSSLDPNLRLSGCEIGRRCFLGLATCGPMWYLAVRSWQSIVSFGILWAHWVHRPVCYVLYLVSRVVFMSE